jgi:hypothetical protein
MTPPPPPQVHMRCARVLRGSCAHSLRLCLAGVQCVEVADCGWHMSFFGGSAAVQAKLRSYAHQEWNTPDIVSKAAAAAMPYKAFPSHRS